MNSIFERCVFGVARRLSGAFGRIFAGTFPGFDSYIKKDLNEVLGLLLISIPFYKVEYKLML